MLNYVGVAICGWVFCGLCEIVADHNWERERNPRWWLQPVVPPNFSDRHAKEAYVMGPVALVTGIMYRRWHGRNGR